MTVEAGSLEVFLPGDIIFDSTNPIAGGGYGDLFKGEHPTRGTLALKRLRSRVTKDENAEEVTRKRNAYITEVGLWRELHHPNVLACIGVLHSSWDEIYLLAPWMENGSLVSFVAHHPDADRTQLLRDAAEGLAYLHQNDIVHGDVKGLNALVTPDRRVALCDFGLSKLGSTINTSTGAVGTLRWQSPELLDGGPRSKQADVYAFGMMIYEILSGRVPFDKYQDSAAVVAVLVRDERPLMDPQQSPKGESYAEHWQIAEICWTKVVEDRPKMSEVVARWPSSLGTAQDQRLFELAEGLYKQYTTTGNAAHLHGAIGLYRGVLACHPPGHPERAKSLYDLAVYLDKRYMLQGDIADLDEAINLEREALLIRPPRDPYRAFSLHNIARYLGQKYALAKKPSDIDEAIVFGRQAVLLRPLGDAYRAFSLHDLGFQLGERYTLTGDQSDLDEAISNEREAVQLRPTGDPQRAFSLHDLAFHLGKRYMLGGNTSDLEDAIMLGRETVELRPSGDAQRAFSLHDLGFYLGRRYELEKVSSDLDDAVTLEREAVQIRRPGDPNRIFSLHDLGLHLSTRYALGSAASDLEEAIQTWEELVKCYEPGHPNYSEAVQSLARLLRERELRQ